MNADAHPTPADRITNWDYEADVVIAGYGIAGAAAAVEAASAGADVLVLERTGGWGGAAAMAGGFIYLGGGTALQQACGFDDSVDNMAAFLNVAKGPGADENRIADYCAGSVAHFDWPVAVRCSVQAGVLGPSPRSLVRPRQCKPRANRDGGASASICLISSVSACNVMSRPSLIRWLITECSVPIHGTAESTSSIVKA